MWRGRSMLEWNIIHCSTEGASVKAVGVWEVGGMTSILDSAQHSLEIKTAHLLFLLN